MTVYVDPARHRSGAGRELYQALLPLLARQRLEIAVAGIALPNDASVALHEAVGFQPVGIFREFGYKAGAWHDVGWWQARLAPAGPAPQEPLGLSGSRSAARRQAACVARSRSPEPRGLATVGARLRAALPPGNASRTIVRCTMPSCFDSGPVL